MSDRESAQKAYQDMQKSNNPSAFDTMGSFYKDYAGGNPNASNALVFVVATAVVVCFLGLRPVAVFLFITLKLVFVYAKVIK